MDDDPSLLFPLSPLCLFWFIQTCQHSGGEEGFTESPYVHVMDIYYIKWNK